MATSLQDTKQKKIRSTNPPWGNRFRSKEAPDQKPKTGNKQTTNRQQTDTATGNKQTTNRQQTDNNRDGSSTGKKKNRQQTDTATGNKQVTNRQQTDTATGNKFESQCSLKMLSGLQRKVVSLIAESIQLSGDGLSEPITSEFLANSCGSNVGSIKMTLIRLVKKDCLRRKESKTGRGGWTRYSIPSNLFSELYIAQTDNKQITNRQQTDIATGNKQISQRVTNPPSSSRYNKNINNNYKSTTTGDEHNISADQEESCFPPEWTQIDYSPLTDLEIKFGPRQLQQCISFGASPDALQESIYHFAWAVRTKWEPEGGGFRSSPLNYFMGCIRSNGIFEFEGYRKQKKQRRELELRWLEDQMRQDEQEENKLRHLKAKHFWQNKAEQNDIRFAPISLGLGEQCEPGCDTHLNALSKQYAKEIEQTFDESYKRSQELQ